MKNSSPLKLFGILAVAAFGLSVANAQEVVTDPVGFINIDVAAGSLATPSDTFVTFPLAKSPVDVGAITSRTANTIVNSSATWTASGFVDTAAPHLVRITSGSATGRCFLITGNTATTLTVDNLGTDLTTKLLIGDNYQIFPAYTLKTLFGTPVPFLTASTAGSADNVLIRTSTGWSTYFHNGTNWKSVGLASFDNTIVYPDDGLCIRRKGAALKIACVGVVPMTAQQTQVSGPGDTFIGNRFPVDATVASLKINTLPNWLSASTVGAADQLIVKNPVTQATTTYFYNGTNWKSIGLTIRDADPIPAGAGLFVRRISTSTVGNDWLSQAVPY
jgi:uncharacterized protein (TIGR02597 family)